MNSLTPIHKPGARLRELRRSAPPKFAIPTSVSETLSGELPELRPIFWLAGYRGQCRAWSRILREQYPRRELLAFAKAASSDDLFCFDMTANADLGVLMVHSFASAGWEYRGRWESFDSWLAAAQLHHIDWMNNDSRGFSPWEYP